MAPLVAPEVWEQRMRCVSLAAVLAAVLGAACTSRDPETLKREYLASGDRYAAQKHYAEAIIQYRNAIAQDGRFGEARLKLAAAYEATGDLQNAYREYIRAADLLPDDVDAQLRAGTMLLAARQFPEARARAEAVLKKDPENVTALVLMGNALAGLNDLDGAISHLSDALDSEPRFVFAYANLGWLQAQKGDVTAAENVFKRAVDIAPESVAARLNLANFYWASRRRAEAEREIKAALSLEPESLDANQLMAAFYITNGQRKEGEPFLKTFARLTPSLEGKLVLADFYLTDGRLAEAAAVVEPLRKQADGFVPATLRLAAIRYQERRDEEAYRLVDEILARDPQDELALLLKARFLAGNEKYPEALALVDGVVKRNPQAVRAHHLRAVLLQALGRIDDAIGAMEQVLALAPSSVIAQGFLAELHLLRGNGRAALELSNAVVKAQPRWPAAHFLRARALLLSGETAAAEATLTALAQVVPTSGEVQTWLGRTYLAKNDYPQARQAFARAAELEPDSLLSLNGLVTLDIVERKTDAARARLEAELARKPGDSALMFLAGNTYMAMGDARRAEALFEAALKLDPSNIDAYSRLGRLYASQGRLDDARSKLQEAIRRQDRSVTEITMLGIVYELQNNPEEARKQYERALELDPRAPVAANNLAWILANRGGNLDVALQLAQTAKAELPTHPNVSNTLGWVYYQKGLLNQSIAALRESVEQAPDDPVKHYYLALAYTKNNQAVQARQSLERALKLNPDFAFAKEAKSLLARIKG